MPSSVQHRIASVRAQLDGGGDLAWCRRVSTRPVRAFRKRLPVAEALHDPVAARVDEARARRCRGGQCWRPCGGSVSRSGDASSARRSANSASGVGLRADRLLRQQERQLRIDRELVAALPASARDLAVVRSFTASCREMSAKISSATDTAAMRRLAPASTRCRRVEAPRLAKTYSCWRAVGPGSLSALDASQPSAAASSEPRRRKLRSRPDSSHSIAFSSQCVCAAVPFEVGVERLHEPVDAAVEVAVADRDPVAYANALGDLLVGHPAKGERDDPLVQLDRVIHLLLAEGRGHRLGADHEHEPVAALHRPAQRGREHLGVADPLGVDPDVLAPFPQSLHEPVDQLRVASRVGDEYVSQGFSWPWVTLSAVEVSQAARPGTPPRFTLQRPMRSEPGLASADSWKVN